MKKTTKTASHKTNVKVSKADAAAPNKDALSQYLAPISPKKPSEKSKNRKDLIYELRLLKFLSGISENAKDIDKNPPVSRMDKLEKVLELQIMLNKSMSKEINEARAEIAELKSLLTTPQSMIVKSSPNLKTTLPSFPLTH